MKDPRTTGCDAGGGGGNESRVLLKTDPSDAYNNNTSDGRTRTCMSRNFLDVVVEASGRRTPPARPQTPTDGESLRSNDAIGVDNIKRPAVFVI